MSSTFESDLMLVLGAIATISMPAIGFFDDQTFSNIHNVLAVLFFGSIDIYSFLIAGIMNRNKSSFSSDD